MGYQPVIDSYNEQNGNAWVSRREVLAWGAGAELIVRITGIGDEVNEPWQGISTNDKMVPSKQVGVSIKGNQNYRSTIWLTYKETWHSDGRDDITSVNLLRPSQQLTGSAVQVIIGRASGGLDHAHLCLEGTSTIVAHFATNGRPVRSASINTASEPILAACLSDGTVALYNVHSNSVSIQPFTEISVIPLGKAGRTWSTRFLNNRYLAVGLGPSTQPIHIYDISAPGSLCTTLRTFGVTRQGGRDPGNDRTTLPTPATTPLSSVYPVIPLANGDSLLLSGSYDGTIRFAPSLPTPFLPSPFSLHPPLPSNQFSQTPQTPRPPLPPHLRLDLRRSNGHLPHLLPPPHRPRALPRRRR